MITRHLVNDAVQSSDNNTYRYDLPTQDCLHALFLRVSCTNGATAGRGVTIHDVVDNIQVLGTPSDPIINLNPREYEKWYENIFRRPLPMIWTEAASGVQEITYPLIFGRSLFDREMWLPLWEFTQPQLVVDYSPTISATVGFATGTTTFDLVGYISKRGELANYLGTLCKRSIRTFTSAAAGDESTKIDTINRIRNIGLYAFEAQVADGSNITRVVLRHRTTGGEIWQGDWQNFMNEQRERFPGFITHQARLLAADNDIWKSRLGGNKRWGIELFGTHDVTADTFALANFDAENGDELTLDVSIADVTAGSETHIADTGAKAWKVFATAENPGYFGNISFMGRDIPEDYLDPIAEKDIELVLTQGNAGADVRISIEELRRFA